MQNKPTACPASTGKIGLPLTHDNFKFAIEKALTLKPRVEYINLTRTMVETANHTGAVMVTFRPYENTLWVICACQFGRDPHDYPKACFHAAAAALERNLFQVPMPIGALVEEKRLESLTYDAVQRTEQHQRIRERFRPRLVPVPEADNQNPEEQRFDWRNYRPVSDAQLKEGWLV